MAEGQGRTVQSTLHDVWQALRRRRWLQLVLGLWLLWLLLSALLVPWWLRNQLPALLQANGVQLQIGQARFNPFTLAITARQIDVRLADQSPLLTMNELRVNLALTLLRRAALGFDEIALIEPRLFLQLQADGSSNWQRLAAQFVSTEPEQQPATEPDAELPRLILHRFELTAGAIQIDDYRYAVAGHRNQIAGLGISLNDVSTLRDESGQYQLQGGLPGGGQFGWRGTVALNPLASDGELTLEAVALEPLAPLLMPAPGDLQGTLATRARYHLHRRQQDFSFQLFDGALTLQDFHWQLAGEAAPLLSWSALQLNAITLDTDSTTIGIGDLQLHQPAIALARDERGAIRGLPAPASPATETDTNTATVLPWTLVIKQLQVDALSAQLHDDSRQLPLALQLAGASVKTAVAVQLGSGDVTLTNLDLGLAELQLLPVTRETVASSPVVASASIESAASTDVTGAPVPLLTLQDLRLTGATVQPAQQQLAAASVSLGGGQLRMERRAGGALWPLNLLAARHPDPEPTPPWHYRIDRVEVNAFATKFTDTSITPAAKTELTLTRAELFPLASPASVDSTLAVQLALPGNASLQLNGSLSADQNRLQSKVELNRLPLSLAQPYLQQQMRADIRSGVLSLRGTLQVDALMSAPVARYRGGLTVDRFQLSAAGEPLLGWQQLTAKGLRFDSAPLAVQMEQLIWHKPVATLHFTADGSSNFTALQTTTADKPRSTAVASVPATGSPAANSPINLRIKQLDLIDGSLDFADARLVLPYRANIQRFNGSVVGLSSAPDSRATVALEGQVDSYGQATLNGELQPLAPTAWLDLLLRFRNVAMSPLTPYSATFAGRKITDGTLTMDLRYRIENGQLKGDNHVVLDKFTLGDPVDSPDAWTLPLDLALAVLKDSEGRIDLAMPVEGNVNDPEFKYGRVIWQALVNVLTRIVTAPFRALASLFGSDAEELAAIVFEPGRSELSPPEREKLDQLLVMISKRPDLQLTVFGQYDATLDKPALQALALRRELSAKLGQTVAAGSQPAPIALSDADSQIALETLFDERFGVETRQRLLQEQNSKRSTPFKTANRLLSTFGGGAGDADWYRQLQQQLEAEQPLPVDALAQLATARADQIESSLAGKLAPGQWQRLPVQVAGDTEEDAVMMGFGLAALSAPTIPDEKKPDEIAPEDKKPQGKTP